MNDGLLGPDEDKDGLLKFDVIDRNSFDYYTTMYVGSAREEVKLAIDTVSLASVIAAQNCQGCQRNGGNTGFKYQDSNTVRKVASQKVEYELAGTVAKGIWVRDDLRLTADEES